MIAHTARKDMIVPNTDKLHRVLGAPSRYRHSAIGHLMLADAATAIDFYKVAFGAEEIFRIADPSGTIIHGEMKIGQSVFMLGDVDDRFREPRSAGGTTVGIHIYVEDVDQLFAKASMAGVTVLQEPQNMFYGDRMTMLQDPFAHIWVFLQPLERLEPLEFVERANKLFKS
jgi:PhnB protein